MPPIIEEFQASVRPFPKTSDLRFGVAVVCGLAAAGTVWAVTPAERSSLASVPLLFGHFVAGAVFAWALGEVYYWWKARKDLLRFAQAPDAVDASDAVWSVAVAECRNHPDRYEEHELPDVFARKAEDWEAELAQRFAVALFVSLLPVVAGLFQGLHELRLSAPGEYLAGFGDVFFPMQVAGAEALLCGGLVWSIRLLWARTLTNWKTLASQAVWEQVSSNEEKPADPKPPAAKDPDPIREVGLQEIAAASAPSEVQRSELRETAMEGSETPDEEAGWWGSTGADEGIRVKTYNEVEDE